MNILLYNYIYIYREEAWGSPERNSSSFFATLQNVIVHCVLRCFVFFPQLDIIWNRFNMRTTYLGYVVLRVILFCLWFQLYSFYCAFVDPIVTACCLKNHVVSDLRKNVIIHQRTMGEMHMRLFILHIHNAVRRSTQQHLLVTQINEHWHLPRTPLPPSVCLCLSERETQGSSMLRGTSSLSPIYIYMYIYIYRYINTLYVYTHHIYICICIYIYWIYIYILNILL